MTEIPAVRKVIMLTRMIAADRAHLLRAVSRGDRVHAHQFVDSIIDLQNQLEDITGKPQ